LSGRYEIVEKLGTGGFGQVWKVKDMHILGSEHFVAKLPNALPGTSNYDRQLDSLKNELMHGRNLHHPHICKYLELHTDDRLKLQWVLMTYSGTSLVDLIRKNEWPQGEGRAAGRALRIATSAARALDDMHKLGICHGDIQPGNILIERNGDLPLNIWLCDLGLAVAFDANERKRLNASVPVAKRGQHPIYSAPEVHEEAEVRPSSDQYSLALVCLAVAQNQLYHKPFKKLPDSVGDLTVKQIQALKRALSADPGERFPSCGEFARAFGAK